MDKTEDNKELTDMAIDSPDQRSATTAANDFDITPTPSIGSSIEYDKHSTSSRSIQAVRSETERYTIVGNIDIMNQMYAIFNEQLFAPQSRATTVDLKNVVK